MTVLVKNNFFLSLLIIRPIAAHVVLIVVINLILMQNYKEMWCDLMSKKHSKEMKCL